MAHCPFRDNLFCSGLSDDDRSKLCPHCVKAPFRKKDNEEERCHEIARMLPGDRGYCVVLVDGTTCTSNSLDQTTRSLTLWLPGDITNFEAIFDVEDDLTPRYRYRYLADGSYALLPLPLLRELLTSSITVGQALLRQIARTKIRQQHFVMGTYLQNARQALTFLLLFCRQYRIEGLTHQDLAYLTGLNRVTVTRTLHEIMQEESGQPVGLMDYIQLLYMGTQKEDSGDHWGRYRGQPSKAASQVM